MAYHDYGDLIHEVSEDEQRDYSIDDEGRLLESPAAAAEHEPLGGPAFTMSMTIEATGSANGSKGPRVRIRSSRCVNRRNSARSPTTD